MSALNATKRDLAEFVSVLGTDTKAAVKGASDNINKILVQSPSQGEEERNNQKNGAPPPVVVAHTATPYDRCQAELFAVQSSSETYLQDPQQGVRIILYYTNCRVAIRVHTNMSDIQCHGYFVYGNSFHCRL